MLDTRRNDYVAHDVTASMASCGCLRANQEASHKPPDVSVDEALRNGNNSIAAQDRLQHPSQHSSDALGLLPHAGEYGGRAEGKC